MVEQINNDYEVSSEGGVRHWEVPYARLEDATPTPTNPACVTSQLLGTQVCGTILGVDATASVATIDFTCGMVYWFEVRTVTTYAQEAESAWADINIGNVVYYDSSATMPAGVYLSQAAAAADTSANPIFGYVMMHPSETAASFPKLAGVAGNTHWCAVMQRGAGA